MGVTTLLRLQDTRFRSMLAAGEDAMIETHDMKLPGATRVVIWFGLTVGSWAAVLGVSRAAYLMLG